MAPACAWWGVQVIAWTPPCSSCARRTGMRVSRWVRGTCGEDLSLEPCAAWRLRSRPGPGGCHVAGCRACPPTWRSPGTSRRWPTTPRRRWGASTFGECGAALLLACTTRAPGERAQRISGRYDPSDSGLQLRDTMPCTDSLTTPTLRVPVCRINNAGTNAYRYGPLMESDDEELAEIVGTNVLGVMLCCKEVRLTNRGRWAGPPSTGHADESSGCTPQDSACGCCASCTRRQSG